MRKTLISEFFTTIDINIFLRTLWLLTFKLPILRYGSSNEFFEYILLWYIWNNNSKIVSFYNWRSAIYHCLKMIWVKKQDEVIVSWYNCVSVSNAVIQSWAKIIYCDIEKGNLGLNTKILKSLINKNTKVIIAQHTFWKPSNIKEIIKIAKENNILVIEDCAHSLWSKIENKRLWSYWDFSIFSSWRDKVISWVTWWFLIVNNKNYFDKLEEIREKLIMPSRWLTIKNLLYNIFAYISYKTYNVAWLWKIIIYISRKLNLITEILTDKEKKCNFKDFNYALPNSLAFLAAKEIENIKFKNAHKISLSEYYDEMIKNKYIEILFKKNKNEKNNYFRYPIILKTKELKEELYNYMKAKNVILWNTWSSLNIVPKWTNLSDAKYIEWTCPVSEDISQRILTIPCHRLITSNDARVIVHLLNNFKN